jgi:hypothetical protein
MRDRTTYTSVLTNRYHELARALGLVGDIPSAGPEAGPTGRKPAA